MGQIAVRKTTNTKIDRRTLDSKRLEALITWNECVSPKRYWTSAAEKAEAEERELYLDSLSAIQLLALPKRWPSAPPPATVPTYTYVEPVSD